ncbi:MAG: ABC transporter ATP-binding protein [Gordonia sp. (in: high G+C Gram-positive bacteria)]
MSDRGRAVVWQAISGQRRYLIPASVFIAIHQGCEAAVPLTIGVVIDRAIAPADARGLCWTIALLACVFLVLTVSMRLAGRLIRHATQGAAHRLRMHIAARVLDTAGYAGAGARGGVLLSTATSDAARVGMVNAAVWTSVGALAAMVVAAVILLRASLVLGIVVVVGLIPVVALTRTLSRPLVERSGAEQAAAAHAAGVAEDLLSGLRVLKGMRAESRAWAKYACASTGSRDAAIVASRLIAIRGGMITGLTGAFLALVAWLGGHLVSENRLSVGGFVTAFTLTQFLIGPFTRITMVGSQFARARASATRIAAILDESVRDTPSYDDAPRHGLEATVGTRSPRVELKRLCAPGLVDIDLDVAPGELVAVAVDEPIGAQSLMRCLGRFADPESGRIELDGASLVDLRADVVRSHILVAAHNAMLFRGTIGDNVAAVTRDRSVTEAAVGCTGVATMVPGGLDAQITERALSLSGGQRQRVALARALAADAPVLVLHDPTTAVDTVTEAAVADGLRRLRSGQTTIVLTTSPALLAVADRVVVIRGERVCASGRHADLLAGDLAYRELVAS